MHKVVIFSNPVVSNGETFYGKLYSGENEKAIVMTACSDFRTLLYREQWEGQTGEEFRNQENWTLTRHKDGSESWSYDKSKYTYTLGFSPLPDEFIRNCWLPPECVALISGWVPLRLADCNDQDYIVNRAVYDDINESNPNHVRWILVDEPDELPF